MRRASVRGFGLSGTSVVIPTRYGLDLGLIIASADQFANHMSRSLSSVGVQLFQGRRADSEEEILFQSESDEHPWSAVTAAIPPPRRARCPSHPMCCGSIV